MVPWAGPAPYWIMGTEPAVSIRLGIQAALKAKAWARRAPHYRGEFAFGAPTVFAVFGDSLACGLGLTDVDQTFAGVVARRLSGRCGRVVCRFEAECGATAACLPRQRVTGDETFAAVSIGTNDLLSVTRRSSVERDLADFLGRMRHARRVIVLGPGDVAAGGILPTILRPLLRQRTLAFEESILRVTARFPNARHVGPSLVALEAGREDFAADGFHPSGRAHQRIAEVVWERLSDAL